MAASFADSSVAFRSVIGALTALVAACGSADDAPQIRTEAPAVATVEFTGTAAVVPLATEDGVDPYVGTWDVAMVLGHLRSVELLPKDLGEIQQPEMGIPGRLLEVDGARLQVFIYADAAARALHTDHLDSVRVTAATDRPVALITSNNLAVLVTGGKPTLRRRLHELFELPDEASSERKGPA